MIFDHIQERLTETELVFVSDVVKNKLSVTTSLSTLAELGLDENDFNKIGRWVSNLTANRVESWLNARWGWESSHFQGKFGLILLLYFSENAKRIGREGRLWPEISVQLYKDNPEIYGSLFSQGHPTESVKEAISDAVTEFRLISAIGYEGAQEYYLTIFLQFGFTRGSITSRLGPWLGGQITSTAIQWLRGYGETSAKNEEFLKIWQHLWNYRKGFIDESTIRQRLTNSDWIPEEWINEIVVHSKDKVERDPDMQPSQLEFSDPDFLKPFQLKWNGLDVPLFTTELDRIEEMDLYENRYLLRIDGQEITTIVMSRNDENDSPTYKPFAPIEIPVSVPTVSASLETDLGETEFATDVDVWEPTSTITIYDLTTGHQFPTNSALAHGKDYGVLTSKEAEVTPDPEYWRPIGNYWKLIYIPAESMAHLKVSIHGELVLEGPSPRIPIPPTIVDLNIEPNYWMSDYGHVAELRIGEGDITFKVEKLDVHSDITFANVEGRQLQINCENNRLNLTLLESDLVDICRAKAVGGIVPNNTSLIFKIGLLEDGLQKIVTNPIDVTLRGSLILDKTGWRCIPKNEMIKSEDLTLNRLKIFPGQSRDRERHNIGDYQIVEGDQVISRLRSNTLSIVDVAGFGQTLDIRPRFNWLNEKPQLSIGSGTLDYGDISNVLINTDGKYEIKFISRKEPSADFSVLHWSASEVPEIIKGDHIDWDGDKTWIYTPAKPQKSSFIMGVGYVDENRFMFRIGSFFSADVSPKEFIGDSIAMQMATLQIIRWLNVPILSQPWRDVLQDRRFISIGTILNGFLGAETYETYKLSQNLSRTDRWMSAILDVISEVEVDRDIASEVIRSLAPASDAQGLAESITTLVRLDPIFAKDILDHLPMQSTVSGKSLIEIIKDETATMFGMNVSDLDDHASLLAKSEDLLNQAAERIGAHGNFVKSLLATAEDNPKNHMFHRNLKICMNIPEFRNYVRFQILTEVVA